jgi:hypothetical protein
MTSESTRRAAGVSCLTAPIEGARETETEALGSLMRPSETGRETETAWSECRDCGVSFLPDNSAQRRCRACWTILQTDHLNTRRENLCIDAPSCCDACGRALAGPDDAQFFGEPNYRSGSCPLAGAPPTSTPTRSTAPPAPRTPDECPPPPSPDTQGRQGDGRHRPRCQRRHRCSSCARTSTRTGRRIPMALSHLRPRADELGRVRTSLRYRASRRPPRMRH